MIDLDAFTIRLSTLLYTYMPKDTGFMREIALGNTPKILGLSANEYTFDIGNDNAEEKAPYYHILEDAEFIHIRGKGTKESKGSQAYVSDLKKRDYGQWTISKVGKPYQEYRQKNYRGKRYTKAIVNVDGTVDYVKQVKGSYSNIHYHYIENIIEENIELLAQEFGLKIKRKQIIGADEQEDITKGLDLLGNLL